MNKLGRAILLVVALLARPQSIDAVTFTGTNQPCNAADFALNVGPGSTNLAVSINGLPSAYSYLLLKAGGTPSETNYDFRAVQNMVSNAINL